MNNNQIMLQTMQSRVLVSMMSILLPWGWVENRIPAPRQKKTHLPSVPLPWLLGWAILGNTERKTHMAHISCFVSSKMNFPRILGDDSCRIASG